MVIYTDSNRLPQGELHNYSIDLDIGKDNDFQIGMNLKNHCMSHGSIWYVENTEYGGIVDDVKIDTKKNTVYYSGRAFRGILEKKIIEPESGQDYYTVSGDANRILEQLIEKVGLSDLFIVPTDDAGIKISNNQFERYTDMYAGVQKMLSSVNAKLVCIATEETKVQIRANQIEDLSEKYEYSDDYGMQVIFEQNRGGVNHLICLGGGELAERTVVHLYVDNYGNVGDTQYYKGVSEITEIYEYGNIKSDEELRKQGIQKLNELKNRDSLTAQFDKLDVDIGDIVGGKNRQTGVTMKEVISSEIVKIKNDRCTVTYKVGE
jgi:hypothetical protein|nr:MAG TPA_asm: Protein gp18.1, prophage tail protein gp18.7A [Caudoviricetes sp.]